jgi:hypothetical protein
MGEPRAGAWIHSTIPGAADCCATRRPPDRPRRFVSDLLRPLTAGAVQIEGDAP